MKLCSFLSVLALGLMVPLGASAQHQFTVNTKPGAEIQPTMYGIFFEDINFGADGGLYAEMVQNRSFDFPSQLMGWNTFGNVSLASAKPAFDRNPNYIVIQRSGHREKRSGIENRGFFGMGFKKDMTYEFSVYARMHNLEDKEAKIRVELVDDQNIPMDRKSISITNTLWKKFTVTLKANKTVEKGLMRIFLESADAVDLDHVSLFPGDNWNGLRADLVKDLEDLHPGVFRFPGGCIVEGTDLATRYQWKNSVGPAENRPLNENRWNYTFAHRMYPNYYQTYGLGFYEYFLLAEKIGAEPLPIVSVGLACQYQNDDKSTTAHASLDDLQPYIDDALDLIEFANGATTTKWGKLRADMGHPEPFGLKQIGIGNEQWGELYPVRLQKFIEQIRKKYPNIMICGSSGPSAGGEQFDYGWKEMRRLGVELVDEHYYMSPDWFFKNAGRYDNYDRKGPKVFAGEYASHVRGIGNEPDVAMNNFEAALSEAAFMTGLERNADLVHEATYAPLFAHVEGWQWRPDLIWFDNLRSVRSVNWYVQMLYATNRGTHTLSLTENNQAVKGDNGLYASAVYDKNAKKYIVKIVNNNDQPKEIALTFKGAKGLGSGTATLLHSNDMRATNSLDNPTNVVPKESAVQANGNNATVTVPAKTFAVYKF